MITLSILTLLVATVLASGDPVASGPVRYDGQAVDLKTNEPLYRERHVERRDGDRRIGLETEYVDMNGTVLARRSASFQKDRYVPEFRLEDQRTGYCEGADHRPDGVYLFSRASFTAPMKASSLRLDAQTVVDAGFNNFIQDRWDDIAAGKTQIIHFGVPSSQTSYQFRIYKVRETIVRDRRLMVVNCDVDNVLIRLFVDPIVLTYDVQARRLVSYEGISNIRDERGTSHIVRITYDPYGP